jgi:hypothetical protein
MTIEACVIKYGALTFLLAADEVFQEINCEAIIGAQVCSGVNCEQLEDFPLGLKFR